MQRRDFMATLIGASASAASLLTAAPLHAAVEGSCTADAWGRRICTVGISTFSAQKIAQRQYQSQWCWAACIAMIFRHYGHSVSQERIVREAYGLPVNMPGSPLAILRSLNREWKDDDGEEFSVVADPYTSNYLTAIEDLKDGHPVLLGALGHAVVLTAMTFYPTPTGPQVVSAIVRDPWPETPARRMMTPAEWYNVQFAARIRVE